MIRCVTFCVEYVGRSFSSIRTKKLTDNAYHFLVYLIVSKYVIKHDEDVAQVFQMSNVKLSSIRPQPDVYIKKTKWSHLVEV